MKLMIALLAMVLCVVSCKPTAEKETPKPKTEVEAPATTEKDAKAPAVVEKKAEAPVAEVKKEEVSVKKAE